MAPALCAGSAPRVAAKKHTHTDKMRHTTFITHEERRLLRAFHTGLSPQSPFTPNSSPAPPQSSQAMSDNEKLMEDMLVLEKRVMRIALATKAKIKAYVYDDGEGPEHLYDFFTKHSAAKGELKLLEQACVDLAAFDSLLS